MHRPPCRNKVYAEVRAAGWWFCDKLLGKGKLFPLCVTPFLVTL